MVRTAPLYDNPGASGTVVRAPRRTDVISGALRRAYGSESYLPPEIAAALARLGRIPR